MATIDIIRTLCMKNKTSIKALEKELGFSNGSLAKAATIKDDRLQRIAEHFNVTVDYLMKGTEAESNSDIPYYINEDAKDMAQFLFDNPQYKVLFDASRKVKLEDIEFVKEMIERFSGNNR